MTKTNNLTTAELIEHAEHLALAEREEVYKAISKSIELEKTKTYRENLKSQLCRLVDEGKVASTRYRNPWTDAFDIVLRTF